AHWRNCTSPAPSWAGRCTRDGCICQRHWRRLGGRSRRAGEQENRRNELGERLLISEANMGTATMGKVLVTALIENLDDLFSTQKVQIPAEQVRRVEVTDALIDTGAVGLLLPKRMVAQLGLDPIRTRPSRTISGHIPLQIYRAVRLTVQGRDCISDVA